MPEWQDITLTICSVAFGYALIPQIMYGFKEKAGTVTLQTSLITAVALYAVAVVYFSLELWFAATACTVTGTLWVILLAQRIAWGKPAPGKGKEG